MIPRARRAATQYALHRARTRNLSAVVTNDLASLAWGSISFAANPANNATITLGGTVVTFGTDVVIGGNLTATLATLLTFLNASANANIVKSTYVVTGSVLGIRAKKAGDATFTLAASAATVSGASLKLVQAKKRLKL